MQSLKDNKKQFNYTKEFYNKTLDNDWSNLALANPNVLDWWQQMISVEPVLQHVNIIDFMKSQKEQGIYDYQKSIEAGKFPEYMEEHREFRWDDIGKLENNPNLDNTR